VVAVDRGEDLVQPVSLAPVLRTETEPAIDPPPPLVLPRQQELRDRAPDVEPIERERTVAVAHAVAARERAADCAGCGRRRVLEQRRQQRAPLTRHEPCGVLELLADEPRERALERVPQRRLRSEEHTSDLQSRENL